MPITYSVFRPDLGALAYEFSLDAAQRGFIGRLVLPVFNTMLQSAQYPVIPTEAMLAVGETARAPRSAYARGDWEFESADYSCRENGWEEPIDDVERAMYRNYIDAESMATIRATMMVLRSQEQRIVNKVMDTKVLANSAVTKSWNSYADADPLADVQKAKDVMRFKIGLEPNAIVMDKAILRHISMCQAVMERVKYTSPNALRGELTIEQLKAYFGVEQIIVSEAVYNSSKKGKAVSINTIWPRDKVLLARVSSGGQDLHEPCLGRTFVWEEDSGALTTEQYREEKIRSDVYRVRQSTDECLQCSGAGYILTGVAA